MGTIFGNWTIEKEIGKGSFGKVYKLVREEFGETYDAALKVIQVPRDQSEYEAIANDGMDEQSVTEYFKDIVEDIVKEFALMSKLKGNSNIVSYEDHMVVPRKDFGWNIYIRMELLTPLYTYVKEHPLSVQEVLQLGIDMCSALDICQKYKIIHRDIKPDNIFISKLGIFKLGDFGIARQLEKTTSGMSLKGTKTYMAPEVAKGLEYNASVDIYSLGIVLYRFLNKNRNPFYPPAPDPIKYSDKEEADLKRFSGQEMPAPCDANQEISDIILKACAYNPKERFQTPQEFSNKLKNALKNLKKEEIEMPVPMKKENALESVQESNKKENLLETPIKEIVAENKDEKTTYLFHGNFMEKQQNSVGKIEKTTSKCEIKEEERKEKESNNETNIVKIDTKKKNRYLKISVIMISVLILSFLSVFVINIMDKKVEMPDLVGKTIGEANVIAEEKEFNIIESTEYSDTIEKGIIIKQNIEEGKKIDKNSNIMLVVSGGKEKIVIETADVPNLKECTEEEAEKEVKEKQFEIIIEKEYSDTIKKGKLISQEPETGTQIEIGSTIKAVFSLGVEKVEVPNLKGKSKQKAKSLLKKVSLKGKFVEKYSDTVAKGKIISQGANAGKKVEKGTIIKCVVSKGKKPVVYKPMPTKEPVVYVTKRPVVVTKTPVVTKAPVVKKKTEEPEVEDFSEWDMVN